MAREVVSELSGELPDMNLSVIIRGAPQILIKPSTKMECVYMLIVRKLLPGRSPAHLSSQVNLGEVFREMVREVFRVLSLEVLRELPDSYQLGKSSGSSLDNSCHLPGELPGELPDVDHSAIIRDTPQTLIKPYLR